MIGQSMPQPQSEPELPIDVFARPLRKVPRLLRALYAVNRVYARAYHHVRVMRPCPVPEFGGGIVVCNHSAGLDPVILQATCPRFLTWMMAKEFYDLPVLNPLCKRLGFIPVARGGRDSSALKASLRALSAGRVMGIFPEGRIEPGLELLPLQPGVAMLAARSDVPIYPAYIAGMRRNLPIAAWYAEPQDVTINWGEPFVASEDQRTATEQLREALEALRKQTLASRLPLRQSAPTDRSPPTFVPPPNDRH